MRLIVTSSVCAALAVVVCGWAVESADSFGINLYPSLREKDEAIVRIRGQRDDFMPHFARIADELAAGRISLREASRAVEQSAVTRYPAFLEYLDTIERPPGLRAKIACNLLRNLQGPAIEDEGRSVDARRLADLKCEYAEILAAP